MTTGSRELETYGIGWVNERIVDGNDIDLVVLNRIAEDDTTNTTETVDSDLGWCHDCRVWSNLSR